MALTQKQEFDIAKELMSPENALKLLEATELRLEIGEEEFKKRYMEMRKQVIAEGCPKVVVQYADELFFGKALD